MRTFLENIDQQIVCAINGWNTPWLDECMWLVSGKLTWIPLYLFLIVLAFRKLDKRAFIAFVIFSIAGVALADLLSVHAFKNVFLRYRPSHNLDIINQLHFYQLKSGEFYRGGMYGFVSSHAANISAIAFGSLLVLRRYAWYLKPILICAVLLISFSRIYLGVHYFSDVLVGATLGVFVSFSLYKLFFQNYLTTSSTVKTTSD
jgi:undecaprenyl-diphosphatase